MKFIHAADIHLDSPLTGLSEYEGAPLEEIRSACRRAFNNLIDLAIAERVDFLIIAGDLIDSDWKDFHSALYLSEKLSRLNNEGIPALIILGNHDAANKQLQSTFLPENVTLFSAKKPETFFIKKLNVAVHGRSYPNAAVEDNLAEGYPPPIENHFNIGILHTALEGREGHGNYAPCSKDLLISKGYDYWALGHAHSFEEVHSDPYIAFSGNIQGRHIRETGSKGCILVEVHPGRKPEAQFKALDVFRWINIEVPAGRCDSAAAAIETANRAILEQEDVQKGFSAAVRIRFTGSDSAGIAGLLSSDDFLNRLRAAITDSTYGRVWIEKISVQLQKSERKIQNAEEGELLEEFIKAIGAVMLDNELKEIIKEEFDDLVIKLPMEVRQTSRMDSGDDTYWKNMIETVKGKLSEQIKTGPGM